MNTHHPTPSHHTSVERHHDRSASALRRRGVESTEEPSHQAAGGFSSILRRYPAVLGVTALIGLVAVTVAALILYRSPDPTVGVLPASVLALALASLGGGITMGKLIPTTPVAAGLLCGGLTAVLLLLVSSLWGDGGLLPWCMSGGTVLLHLLGGAISRPRQKPPTHTTGKHHSHR